MIVCGCDRDQFAHAQLGQSVLRSPGKFCRIIHGTHTNDRALPLSEPRHRVAGTDATRVRERYRNTGEIIQRELVLPAPAHDVLIFFDKRLKVEGLALLNGCHHERTGAVLLRQVDR